MVHGFTLVDVAVQMLHFFSRGTGVQNEGNCGPQRLLKLRAPYPAQQYLDSQYQTDRVSWQSFKVSSALLAWSTAQTAPFKNGFQGLRLRLVVLDIEN
jgi:hypothetical protein